MLEKRLQEIKARRIEIRGLLSEGKDIDLTALNSELDALDVEEADIQKRQDTLRKMNSGVLPVTPLDHIPNPISGEVTQRNAVVDK